MMVMAPILQQGAQHIGIEPIESPTDREHAVIASVNNGAFLV